MAVLIQNSDLVQTFVNKQRLRTMNYRGSVLTTVVEDSNSWASSDANSYLYLTLVPYSAALRSIKVCFASATTELVYKVGIAGINPDFSFTDIKDDLFSVPAAATAANIVKEIVPATLWGKTIYQQLCEGDYNLPSEAFDKYSESRYGVLFLKSTTKNTAAVQTIRANIEWVEGAPSEAPLISKTYSK